jgi:NgoMIV restriction enzyme
MSSLLADARLRFHSALQASFLTVNANGVPSNADKDNTLSVALARGMFARLGVGAVSARVAGQTSGNQFELLCENFLRETFTELIHLRPGNWIIQCVGGRNRTEIARYEQYAHIAVLDQMSRENLALRVALGSDYLISPDLVIARQPESDEQLNAPFALVDETVAQHASLRFTANARPILHASISCKWTIRSDRAQNARSEALNLVRNRKGHLPHIVVVTGEPLPSRIASLALGTGDIDCVYHVALPELIASVEAGNYEDARELLEIMVSGKRLKDIADLPLDLAV